MSIHVQCADCGAKFRAPEKLAGKRVKCPKCSAAITVGEGPPRSSGQAAPAEETTPLISVACRCGKKLRVKTKLAGKRVKCPGCGQALPVPGTGPAPAQPAGELDLGQLAGVEAGAATTLGAPLAQAKKKEQPSHTRLIIGLSVGGGAAVLVLLLVLVLWPSGEDKEVAKENGASSKGVSARPLSQEKPRAGESGPRTYPSLPDAPAEPPAWIGSAAPFDVAEFLEVPRPEENAALLYLDALFEFSSDVAMCFYEQGQEPEGEIFRRIEIANERHKEYFRLEEARRKNPASVDNTAVDAWLKGYETGFQKLAVSQQHPACVFETGVSPFPCSRTPREHVKWRES